MFNPTKDDRERTPKEQAANFVASIGGLKRQSIEGAEIAQDLSDLLLKVAALPNPTAVARACSQAMTEWADVGTANPSHARELAKLAAKATRGITPERNDYARAGMIAPERPADPAPVRRPGSARRMTP